MKERRMIDEKTKEKRTIHAEKDQNNTPEKPGNSGKEKTTGPPRKKP